MQRDAKRKLGRKMATPPYDIHLHLEAGQLLVKKLKQPWRGPREKNKGPRHTALTQLRADEPHYVSEPPFFSFLLNVLG